MNVDNQHEYWDKVAAEKTFSHPVSSTLLHKYIPKNAVIVDFGCGYGRVLEQLVSEGFTNITGYDTSMQLVQRGKSNQLPIYHIPAPADLPFENNSVDCILLFAVLTCIPSNKGQAELIHLLHSRLKPGGILYISDYYLQDNELSKKRYTYYNGEPENFGVFQLPEGGVFRHHSREWIANLLKAFIVKEENLVEVKTMNGNKATAFQLVVAKPL